MNNPQMTHLLLSGDFPLFSLAAYTIIFQYELQAMNNYTTHPQIHTLHISFKHRNVSSRSPSKHTQPIQEAHVNVFTLQMPTFRAKHKTKGQ